MKRGLRRLVLSYIGLGLTVSGSGCTGLNHGARSKSEDRDQAREAEKEKEEGGGDKPLDVKSEGRPFFKSSRLPGAMSDEGREIEQSLGIK